MSIEWNRVTWYSKLLAVVVFLAAFVIAFNLGILYQQVRINTALLVVPSATVTVSSTTEAIPSTIRISVSSTTDAAASTTAATASTTDIQIGGGAGARCGGFIQNAPACAKGFRCQLNVSRPDTGGTCVAD